MPTIFTHSPLLGTVVEITVEAPPLVAEQADAAAVGEFGRLNAVFSTHDDASELCRWRSGATQAGSADLVRVLAAAQHWFAVSGGAFHPATGALHRRWLQAESDGRLPDPAEVAALAPGTLPYRIDGDQVVRTGDCSGVDLNAIAKGYIVDRAALAAAAVPGVAAVTVNAGGDLRRIGSVPITVGIEDPATPFDNAPARWRVRVADGALATSGTARRGFRVGGRWFGHVLDPRTGWPVDGITSVTVLAPDTMSADALATVLGVLGPGVGLEFAIREGIACLLVTGGGEAFSSPAWPGR